MSFEQLLASAVPMPLVAPTSTTQPSKVAPSSGNLVPTPMTFTTAPLPAPITQWSAKQVDPQSYLASRNLTLVEDAALPPLQPTDGTGSKASSFAPITQLTSANGKPYSEAQLKNVNTILELVGGSNLSSNAKNVLALVLLTQADKTTGSNLANSNGRGHWGVTGLTNQGVANLGLTTAQASDIPTAVNALVGKLGGEIETALANGTDPFATLPNYGFGISKPTYQKMAANPTLAQTLTSATKPEPTDDSLTFEHAQLPMVLPEIINNSSVLRNTLSIEDRAVAVNPATKGVHFGQNGCMRLVIAGLRAMGIGTEGMTAAVASLEPLISKGALIPVNPSDVKPGDIAYDPGHVGIVNANGQVVHNSSSAGYQGVAISTSDWNNWFQPTYYRLSPEALDARTNNGTTAVATN